jgi:hypothetical protein
VRLMADRWVDFFISGVQKGGTTALYSKLKDHPEINLSTRKELHFFDDEQVDWQSPDYAKLHEHFEFERDGVFGEATPIYTYWPDSIQRIRDYNAAAKIIIILRHPSFRALSAWKMERARSNEALSFGPAISQLGRLRVRLARNGVHRVYSYVERGFYSRQIGRVQSIFPRDQILFLTSDQLWLEEVETLLKISRFLDVSDGFFRSFSGGQKYIVPVDSSQVELPKKRLIAKLNKLFSDDIEETSRMTGLDLSSWSDPNYREPMRPT